MSKLSGKDATGLPLVHFTLLVQNFKKTCRGGWTKINFTIIDQDDQVRLIKNICKAENIDVKYH